MIRPYTPPDQGQSASLTVFQNTSLGISVRTVTIDGDPWFVAKDVCDAFGDSDHKRSISRLDEDDKQIFGIKDRLGRNQMATVVNESGLYYLLFGFEPQKAKRDGGAHIAPHVHERIEKLSKFKRWVTRDVLPSIRKTGGYMVARQGETEDELNAKIEAIVQEAVRKRDEQLRDLERKVIRYAPVVLYLNAVSPTSTLVEVGVLANLIDNAGKSMGRTRLFNLLREMGYVCRVKGRYNHPTQKAVDAGVLTLSEENGRRRKTMVTPRGKVFFTNLFLSGEQLDFLAGLRVAV